MEPTRVDPAPEESTQADPVPEQSTELDAETDATSALEPPVVQERLREILAGTPGDNYWVLGILNEAFPTEAQALYETYAGIFADGQIFLSLAPVAGP